MGVVGPPIAPKRVVDVRESLSARARLFWTRGVGDGRPRETVHLCGVVRKPVVVDW